jgi:hypothetical protein
MTRYDFVRQTGGFFYDNFGLTDECIEAEILRRERREWEFVRCPRCEQEFYVAPRLAYEIREELRRRRELASSEWWRYITRKQAIQLGINILE